MQFAKVNVPLFGRSVLMVIGCDSYEAIKHFREYAASVGATPPDLTLPGEFGGPADGWCQLNNGDIYIWESSGKFSVMLHETVHAAFQLCLAVSMKPDEELICRLVEFLKLELLDQFTDAPEPAPPLTDEEEGTPA